MSEQFGRCRSEVVNARDSYAEHAAIADAIDRLAADVAAVKASVERIEAVATTTAVTLTPTAEQAAALRAAAVEIKATPVAPQPAAPPAGWLTEEERGVIVCADFELSAIGHHRSADKEECLRLSAGLRSLVKRHDENKPARAGSPPVVEVPAADWDAVANDPASMTLRRYLARTAPKEPSNG